MSFKNFSRIHLWIGSLLFIVMLVLAQRHAQAQHSQSMPQSVQLSLTAQQFLDSLPQEWRESSAEYLVTGEILVGVRPGNLSKTARLGLRSGLTLDLLQSMTMGQAGDKGTIVVQRWSVPAGSEWSSIAVLQSNPDILFAEPNWLVHAAQSEAGTLPSPTPTFIPTALPTSVLTSLDQPYVPNDPLYLAWQWYLQRINASRALALVDDGSGLVQPPGEIVVGVIDSGVDFSHPEFQNRLMDGFNFVAASADPDLQTCKVPVDSLIAPQDDFGHGTHVTGLIAAGLNNGSGIAGVAPFAKIQPLKMLDNRGSGQVFDLSSAIVYAATCLGVEIINMSLEVPASFIDSSPALGNTLRAAITLAHEKNVLLIAAGGNRPTNPLPYPAAYPDVVAVAALSYNNTKTNYSATGEQIDIAAPGGESSAGGRLRIYSTWSRSALGRCVDDSDQLMDGGYYCNDHGTSMAAPLVSGVAALVWSVRPELSADEVRAILLETATPLNLPASQVGSGRLDAHRAVRRALPSQLVLKQNKLVLHAIQGAASLTATLRLDNPSLEAMSVTASLAADLPWVGIGAANLTANRAQVGYGTPAFLQLVFSPAVATGHYSTQVVFVGTRQDTSQVTMTAVIDLFVDPALGSVEGATTTAESDTQIYFPSIFNQSGLETITPTPSPTSFPTSSPTPTQTKPSIATPTPLPTPKPLVNSPAMVKPAPVVNAFRWETPLQAANRTFLMLSATAPFTVELPASFTFTMSGRLYTDLSVFADGYVTFPASEAGAVGDNQCLPALGAPQQAIYGWWSDLTPATGSVSTFLSDADTFVIEFNSVVAANVSPAYTISYQIVLHSNGDIGLNYLDVPAQTNLPPPVTIGVESLDDRFMFQVACSTPNQIIGELPRPNQSYLIKARYLH